MERRKSACAEKYHNDKKYFFNFKNVIFNHFNNFDFNNFNNVILNQFYSSVIKIKLYEILSTGIPFRESCMETKRNNINDIFFGLIW